MYVNSMEDLSEELKDRAEEAEKTRALAFQVVFKDHGVTLDIEEVRAIIDESYDKFITFSEHNINGAEVH